MRTSGGSFPTKRLLVLAAALGVVVAVLPVVAGFATETEPTISAMGSYGSYYWSPSSKEVAEGGKVIFQNSTPGVPHGIEWTGGPATPTCTGVPIDKGEEGWKGSCQFTKAGTYTFKCVVHPYMTGTIAVSSSGTTTTTTTAPPPSTTTGTTPAPSPESPLVGSPSQALKLAKSQRGRVVKGSLDVSKAGAGDQLEVDVFAANASLARHATHSRVGAFNRSSVTAGKTSFSVKLNAKARRALKRRHRLVLTVKVTLTPLYGEALTIARSVVQHP